MADVHFIAINQVGYLSDAEKGVFFSEPSADFKLIHVATNRNVYTGMVGEAIYSESAGRNMYHGAFTSVRNPGVYQVEQNGKRSVSFEIGEKPYSGIHKGLLKAFYYLRCGVALEAEYAGPWQHDACHLSEGIIYGEPDRKIDCAGGWHDAGDYGKYTVAAAKALADLLLAYECFPTAFQSVIPIPETDGKLPDVLHECRIELEWLFKMQKEDGSVYHKVTTMHFPGLDVMPEADVADLYVSPVSATATATFAAVMAMASRIYQNDQPTFANQCLTAAIQAWEWLEHHPNVSGFKNPTEITTGEYGDEEDRDERYWAAGELYRTTREGKYDRAFQAISEHPFSKVELGWADVGGYGSVSYLLHNQADKTSSLYQELSQMWISEADRLLEICREDGLGISLKPTEFIWGSNMLVMNRAMHLLIAHHLQPNPDYEQAALNHVHYLLGRNTLALSYVTGFGEKSVRNIHHRPSVGDGIEAPVPGFVSGGPNKNLQDPISVNMLQGKAPAEAFIDHIDSYATNEMTIYWNSPAVFVLSYWNQ